MSDDFDEVVNLTEENEDPNKRRNIELTDKEKEKIKKAVKDMENNMTGPQNVMGREFTGAGFAGNPQKILFDDFTVGVPMEKTVEITNISLGFNSFKLLPLDDEIIDFFEITYKPCGRIPAGISTSIGLKFTPMMNKDYKSNLKLLSETGLCLIPLECLCKKCEVEVKNPVLDFGEIILGQEKMINLNISSLGALSCAFKMLAENEDELPHVEEEEEELISDELKQYMEFTEHKIIKEKNLFTEEYHKIKNNEASLKQEAIKQNQINQQLLSELNQKQTEYLAKKAAEEQLQEELNNKEKDKKKPHKNVKDNKKKEKEEEEFNYDKEKEALNIPKETLEEQLDIIERNIFSQICNLRYIFLLKQMDFTKKGNISEYSSKNINFIIIAKYLGSYTENIVFKIFFGKESKSFPIQIKYTIKDFPVFSEKKRYDFNYVVDGNMFRQKINLRNISPLSYKLQIYQHKSTCKTVEINPDLGYIQANSDFEIWIKLKINNELLDKLHNFFRIKNNENSSHHHYNIPLKVYITNIDIPFIIQLSFSSTIDRVSIIPRTLKFNSIYIDEGCTIPIKIKNNSLLPQKYGFVIMPKEIKADPSIGTLLPNEEITINCTFNCQDTNLGIREGDIFLRVSTSELTCQKIKIKYIVEIFNSDIQIKPKQISFPKLPEGEKQSLILTIKNKSNKNFSCEWMLPPFLLSGLRINPVVMEIPAENYTTCFLEYQSDFRPYGPFSLQEIKDDIEADIKKGSYKLELEDSTAINTEENQDNNSNNDIENDNNEDDEEFNHNFNQAKDNLLGNDVIPNPHLKVKVKNEFDNILNNEEKDKKKKDEKKVDRNKEVKKDKKQLEEEEKRKKEQEEEKIRAIEERKNIRLNEFTREIRDKELKMFGCEKHSYAIPGDYDDFINNHNDYGDYLSIYNEEELKSSSQSKKDLNQSTISNNNIDKFNKYKTEISKYTIPLYFKEIKQNKTNEIIKKSIIQIETFTCEPVIAFNKEEVNFGEVSVKTRKVIYLGLINRTNTTVDLKIKPLLLTNCFHIVNAVREIPPYGSYNCIIEFFPLLDVPYKDELIFYSETTQASICLYGKGVSPEVSVNIENGILFMGNTVVNNPLEKKFEITNLSKFKISFDIRSLVKGKTNFNQKHPFIFIPQKGEINGEGKIEIKVLFYGDHQDYLNFFEYFLVHVDNQKKPNYIFLSACCWTRQIYVRKFFNPCFYNYEQLKERAVDQQLFKEPYAIANIQETLKLIFYKYDKEKAILENNQEYLEKITKRKVIIGNCRLIDAKAEKNANFEVVFPVKDEYFNCETMRGTLNSGVENVIVFTFKKPSQDPILGGIESLEGLGMWVETKAEIRISGGFIPNGVNDSAVIEVILKAYIDQI